MREGSYTGIHRFIPEDFAVCSSMGPINLCPMEHLVPADLGIARFRRRLLDNAQRLERGEPPIGLDPQESTKAAYLLLEEGQSWKAHYEAATTGQA